MHVVRMRYNKIQLAKSPTLSMAAKTIDGNTVLPLPQSMIGPVLLTLDVLNAPCAFSLARVTKSVEPLFGPLLGATSQLHVERLANKTLPFYQNMVDGREPAEKRAALRQLVESGDDKEAAAGVEAARAVFAGLLHDRGIVTLMPKNCQLALQFDGELSDRMIDALEISTCVANAWVRSANGAPGHWMYE